MSGYEAADKVQPQKNIRYYRLVRKKSHSYLWAVLVLFCITAFLSINNLMLLQSYKELKDSLGSAYRKISTEDSARTGLTKQNESLEEQIARLSSENSMLEDDNAKASRGSINILQQMESVKKLNSELMKKNKELVDDNIALQNSLKIAASTGVKPQSYSMFQGLTPRTAINRGKYAGKFFGTAYTPSEEECGNNKGITSSGMPIIPGVTIAVDSKYWPYGTVFYIKGLGYTVAMDTGSAIKGKNRFDFSVLDKKFANELGAREWEVYLVKLGNGTVGNFKL